MPQSSEAPFRKGRLSDRLVSPWSLAMASVTVPPPVRPHVSAWFASPWLWAALGLVVQGVCILWLYAGRDAALRIGLVWAGLLCAGVAVTIRFQTPAPAASAPAGLRLLLAVVFA